ncbi:MAG: hypothetical protein M0R03_02770 [Novosphingobium sp.]|nr:hypothetical protein [Novosphingobium sp.]
MTGGLLAVLAAVAAGAQAPAEAPPLCLTGLYDGSGFEMASTLELSGNGRFRYMLSYGALDEEAEGTWRVRGDTVLLTSDPVNPPRYALISDTAGEGEGMKITLRPPRGLSVQYFALIATYAGGRHRALQFVEDDLVIGPDGHGEALPESVRVTLPVFDVTSDPLPVGAGREIVVRFDPNELGKVAFAATPLVRGESGLTFERHGRDITFRHCSGPCLKR